ncbi:MAG: TonB-dependent siderophore receptor [Gemmobacter sp.]|uniref:TonB-dependent siderophore receptor n=1 Tax=Gemmobacter sp. TaxID=1898957 RepID=UPI001A3E3246|nr:TonB-dependent siderophore receptor [Gemmobacter sp.]MBL8563246.1 TonB-dependent siderophore receptor [Gemmobacter sp.]
MRLSSPPLRPAFLTLCRRPMLALALGGSALVPSALLAQEGETVLDTVVLDGGAASPIAGGTGYLAETSATGVKAGVPVTEVPQATTTVTEAELADRDPVQIEDALAYVPGVVASPWGVDDRYDQFVIRGFDLGTSGIFRDGLVNKSMSFTGFKIDPYMVQRIDVLKGPASVLYGSNDAAGLVNIVTKRPSFTPESEARLSYGSHNTAELALDTGGANADGTLAWRLTGLTREGANEMQGSQDDRDLLALGLTWAPTDRTTVTFLAHWQKDNLTANSFQPVAGEDYALGLGALPDNFANSQHPWNRFATEQTSIGWQAEHSFSEALTLRQNFRHARQTTDYRHLYFNGMILPDYTPSADSMNFAAFAVEETGTTTALDTQLEYTSDFGGAENILTFGVDLSRKKVDGTMGWVNSYQVPIVGADWDFDVTTPAPYQDQATTVEEQGLYVQNHLRLSNGVTVTAGLRRSAVENRVRDHLSGASSRQKDDATTGMIGATWDLGNGLVPYASYAESFTTNIGTTFGGDQFAPTEGQQLEAGLRYSPEGSGLQFAAALFDITKSNVLTSDPAHAGFSVQTGEVRHRGLELEARGQITDQLSVIAGYTVLDAKITKSNDGDAGNRTPLVPRQQASVWAQYAFAGQAKGLNLGAGLRYVGQAWGDTANTRSVDSYLLADMTVSYDWEANSLAFGVTNLFDKDYAATCDSSVGCIKGEGREMTLTLSRKF